MYDSSTCTFSWSIYFARNIGSSNVLVAYKSDYTSIVGAFLSISRNIHIGKISLTGTLFNLLKVISEGTINSYLNDIMYE
jgi:hypothetical protein